jgi:hypothetical protein
MPAFRPANAVRTRARSEVRSVRNDRWRKDTIRKREVAKRLRVALAPKWDQEFESAFLQRGVCELSVPGDPLRSVLIRVGWIISARS